MKKPPKLRKEQLQDGYTPPTRTDGHREELSGGRLITRPCFSTSASRQEQKQQARPANSANSMGYATSVSPNKPPSNVGRNISSDRDTTATDDFEQPKGGFKYSPIGRPKPAKRKD
ncbi:hypothetical protein OAK87_00625 [bacterium]|nr:hypothetical protein [bacterium]